MFKFDNRPRLEVEKDDSDKLLDVIGIAALIFLIVYPIIYYGQLPERIPSHFDAEGNVDSYSSIKFIWFLPLLGSLIYLGFRYLVRFPHIYNYAVKITKENAAFQYKNGVKMLRVLNTLIVLLLSYLNYLTIEIGLGRVSSLGPDFMVFAISTIFISMGFFIYRSIKNR